MIITIAQQDYEVEYTENPLVIGDALALSKAPIFTFDTETTGLHIKKDRPFLGAVCFARKVYVFPTTKAILKFLPFWSTLVKRLYAHNTPYDMHMVANIMEDDMFPLLIKNWGDTMGNCRLTFEAVSARDGGDKLGLKIVGKKYIDPNYDRYEKAVKAWLKAKESANNKVLTALIRGVEGWTKKRFEAALGGAEPLPDEIVEVHREWRLHYPKPTYQDVPMELMIPYVAVDVIGTKILAEKSVPVAKYREQLTTLTREFKVLPIVYKMERVGIKVNRPYLQMAAEKLEQYIDKLYIQLHELAGMEFSVGQHKVIKAMYKDILGEEPESTDKKFLKKMTDKGDKCSAIISRLRRLEKWKKTYVDRILEVSEHDGRFYTQLNQFNPVSGRFSGDAQQFPKDPIYTEEGYEFEKTHPNQAVPEELVLYHPRRAFEGRMYYLDYSQVELRVQGHYTLSFGGDLNLCRAYMPYRCTHYKSGESYDYKTVAGRARWGELREGAPGGLHWEEALEQGWSAWTTEFQKPWIPTDVHMATTLKALVAMGKDPETMEKSLIKWWRKKGKTFNFMRNYGGGDAKAAETLDITLEQAKAMNRGYTDAFPMVVVYQQKVIDGARTKGYVVNMCGRRYYLSNWNKHYKLGNYLIQGTCADLLKDKMIEIDQFLTDNNISWEEFRMMLCVHDELQFEDVVGKYGWVIDKIKAIMEDIPIIKVPIVAEVEFTDTNWADKRKVDAA